MLPDHGPTPRPVASPISRRLLDDLQLTSRDRLLAVGARDPQFLELAADAVGPHGHITSIEPDLDRLHRARRHVAHLCHVAVLPELPYTTAHSYDAIALVARDGIVPDAGVLRRFAEWLDAGGRLAVVAFAAPAGRVASSGIVRTSASDASRRRRFEGSPCHPSRADRQMARARRKEVPV